MSLEKPWLKNYPAGVPEFIDPDAYSSVVTLLEECCQRFSSRPAMQSMGKIITYAELDQLSLQFANFLVGELKLAKGERIALMLPNLLQYPIAIFGALRAGLAVVNTNPLYTEREIRHQLEDSGAVAVVVVDNFAHNVAKAIRGTACRHVITTGFGDALGFPRSLLVNFVVRHVKKLVPPYDIPGTIRFHDALRRGADMDVELPQVSNQDTAFLQYTGGTTGVAKGARLSHRNMVANVEQAFAWLRGNAHEGEERIITALPLYHIFALTANFLTFTRLGGLNLLIANPRDMPGFVKEIKDFGATAITGVNTLFNALLHTPGFSEVDFSRLHLSLGGGMAVQRAVAERWKKATGVTLSEAYGLTETSPAACINPLDLPEYNGSIGLPISSTDASIMDEDGNHLPLGEIGELVIRGPQVMDSYWHRPEETAKVLMPDGWLRTGDIGRIDEEGFVYIVDRKKDMILVSGFNVYPNEIEGVIVEHPGVVEVAAVGVPDEHSGEVVKLFIVRSDPALTEQEIIDYAHSRLTGYKRPRHVEFRESLPKTNVGKILRRELRDEHVANGS